MYIYDVLATTDWQKVAISAVRYFNIMFINEHTVVVKRFEYAFGENILVEEFVVSGANQTFRNLPNSEKGYNELCDILKLEHAVQH
jgi:hypothetical protein